jgi:hypothetical protein
LAVLHPMPDKQESASIWNPTQRKYMLWLATPTELRVPLTESALAKELKVNPATLWKWRQKPEFRAEVKALITASLWDAYHDAMGAFKKQAARGSFPHLKMFFEMMGVYTERMTLDMNLLREEAEQIKQELGLEPLDTDEVVGEALHILKAGSR